MAGRVCGRRAGQAHDVPDVCKGLRMFSAEVRLAGAELDILPGPRAPCAWRRAKAGYPRARFTSSPRAGRIGYRGHRGLSSDRLGGKVHVADCAQRGAHFCGRNLDCEFLFLFALARLTLERSRRLRQLSLRASRIAGSGPGPVIANRNQLMHSHFAWDENLLYKTTKKGEIHLATPSLAELRRIADDMNAFFNFGRAVSNAIKTRQFEKGGTFTWPDKPQLPQRLHYS